jgi:hypothetical protein
MSGGRPGASIVAANHNGECCRGSDAHVPGITVTTGLAILIRWLAPIHGLVNRRTRNPEYQDCRSRLMSTLSH